MYIGINAQNLKKWVCRIYNRKSSLQELLSKLTRSLLKSKYHSIEIILKPTRRWAAPWSSEIILCTVLAVAAACTIYAPWVTENFCWRDKKFTPDRSRLSCAPPWQRRAASTMCSIYDSQEFCWRKISVDGTKFLPRLPNLNFYLCHIVGCKLCLDIGGEQAT